VHSLPILNGSETVSGGIHRTVIKPGGTLSTITDAMYNEPLTFDVVPGSNADIRIFRLHGPITLANLFDFQKLLNAGTEKVTIIDFTESEYMDSAGLGALLNFYVSGKRHGRFLRLVAVNYRVAELLKLTSAHTLIKTYDTIEAAEAATS
jgi:anti-anti-sigma factor